MQICRFISPTKLWKRAMLPMSKPNVPNHRWVRGGKVFVLAKTSTEPSMFGSWPASKPQRCTALPSSCLWWWKPRCYECLHSKLQSSDKRPMYAPQSGTNILHASLHICYHRSASCGGACLASHWRSTTPSSMGGARGKWFSASGIRCIAVGRVRGTMQIVSTCKRFPVRYYG